ncbi:MAG: EAL domain-containing protein [Candidatus Eremiobacteraeota bacterium]|nr:EAL domain-containing protein [Candidatus Eremiobacteraeota bacterium]
MRDSGPSKRLSSTAQARHDLVRELLLAAAVPADSSDEQIAQTLAVGRRLLDCDLGAVFEVDGPRQNDIPERLCRLALATDGAIAIDDLRGIPYLDEVAESEKPLRAFIGGPISARGSVIGTLNFAALEPRRVPFSDGDRDLVALMGALVGGAIDRRSARERLRRLAYYDPLTNLPNRVHFLERLRERATALATSGGDQRLAVILLDLDHFKEINDTFGHGRGDAVLLIVGERLRERIGDRGFVARTSGDEFAVLIDQEPALAAIDRFAEELRAAIDAPIVIGGYEQYVTASFGVSVSPEDGTDSETLVKHADVAMYRAKDKGRNFVQRYMPVLNAAVTTRLQQEKALRKAVARREFLVYYQPQVELATGRLFGIEALVRWRHPKLGVIRPDLFIPNAESSSVIVLIGEHVMETACQHLIRWHGMGFDDLRVSVNLSARQFRETDLPKRVRSVLEGSRVRPETVDFEITESVAMEDAQRSIEIMQTLRELGVGFSLDDFGTGYSSLGYLRRFPIDCLKIDQSFVRDMVTHPDDATIVRTVIAMAHNLGLSVCAEGVENREQSEFLRLQRCDRVQGYVFATPLPAEEFEHFLLRSRANATPGASPG